MFPLINPSYPAHTQHTQDDWIKRAELAVSKGEDDLAREALKRRKAYQDTAESMRTQLEAQQKAVDQLIANTRVLEGKLAEAKSKKDTLKARAASAKTSKQVQEMMGSLNTSNAVVAFDKMEEKVRGRGAARAVAGRGFARPGGVRVCGGMRCRDIMLCCMHSMGLPACALLPSTPLTLKPL